MRQPIPLLPAEIRDPAIPQAWAIMRLLRDAHTETLSQHKAEADAVWTVHFLCALARTIRAARGGA